MEGPTKDPKESDPKFLLFIVSPRKLEHRLRMIRAGIP